MTPPPVPTVDQPSLQELILRQVATMFALVDHGEAPRSLDHCTEDFVMQVGGHDVGRPRYDEFMEARANVDYTTRHAFSNVQMAIEADGSIGLEYLVTVVRREHADGHVSQSAADFGDRWTHIDGRWLLARRSIDLAIDSRPAVAQDH
jgi:hypothetical protein